MAYLADRFIVQADLQELVQEFTDLMRRYMHDGFDVYLCDPHDKFYELDGTEGLAARSISAADHPILLGMARKAATRRARRVLTRRDVDIPRPILVVVPFVDIVTGFRHGTQPWHKASEQQMSRLLAFSTEHVHVASTCVSSIPDIMLHVAAYPLLKFLDVAYG